MMKSIGPKNLWFGRVWLPIEGSMRLLGPFLDSYIKGRTDIKKRTMDVYQSTRRNLIDFFGEDKPLSAITRADSIAFRRWLSTEKKLAKATVARRIGATKMFFNHAINSKVIVESPFQDQKSQVQGNSARMRFIENEVIMKVIDACPNWEWRLTVALARYGGLRVPSEPSMLKWEDIFWDQNRIKVTSPKTAHHERGEFRFIPIFPELRPFLNEAWAAAEDHSEYIITTIKAAVVGRETGDWKSANIRTQFRRIISRAGVEPWPKLWQNLRSTRETELQRVRPAYQVAAWIGHSEKVAEEFYLQMTDQDFLEASNTPTIVSRKSQQQAIETIRTGQKCQNLNPFGTTPCEDVREATTQEIRLSGFEPPTYGLGIRCSVP